MPWSSLLTARAPASAGGSCRIRACNPGSTMPSAWTSSMRSSTSCTMPSNAGSSGARNCPRKRGTRCRGGTTCCPRPMAKGGYGSRASCARPRTPTPWSSAPRSAGRQGAALCGACRTSQSLPNRCRRDVRCGSAWSPGTPTPVSARRSPRFRTTQTFTGGCARPRARSVPTWSCCPSGLCSGGFLAGRSITPCRRWVPRQIALPRSPGATVRTSSCRSWSGMATRSITARC